MTSKGAFDILFAAVGVLILSPLFLIITVVILLYNGAPIFYIQKRIGQYGVSFDLIKFRTMVVDAEQRGSLTIGNRDSRVTKPGYYLRKYKLDELPQLFNILKGDMSFVGPRPEVEKYVKRYTDRQRRVLSVKPGITDRASIKYVDENELLAKSDNPESFYLKRIMPDKIEYNLRYIDSHDMMTDIKILLLTLSKIIKR
jgi:lipopolysaccharide/colanic/teichoic acid biosynthesis glycosyltransferase